MIRFRQIALGAAALALASPFAVFAGDVSGQTTVTYISRSAPGVSGASSRSDRDLDFWARAQASTLFGGRADGRLTFRAFKDLDGTGPDDPLYQVGDSYSHRGDVQLYEGYFSVRLPATLPGVVAVGRQYLPVGVGSASSFDGLTIRGAVFDNAVRVVLFGGERVSHYRTPDTKVIAGGSVSVSPWNGGAIELSDLQSKRNLWDITISQRFPGDRIVGSRVSFVDDRPDSVRMNADLPISSGLSVAADYLRTMGKGAEGKEFPFDFTSLDEGASSRLFLGLPAPYARYGLRIRKRLGASIVLAAGGARRKLIHDENEDGSNRSEWEGEGSVDARDFPFPGLSAYGRIRHVWEDRKKSQNGSSSIITAGITYLLSPTLTLGGELFANGEHRVVPEPLLPEGVSTTDRNERGRAVFLQWAGRSVKADVRYESTRDDLYVFYGTKSIQSIAVTATVALGGDASWRLR